MLTDAIASNAAPGSRAYKLTDSGGMHLYVSRSGSKSWRFKYRFGGREKLLTIGRFPALQVADARTKRDKAKEQLRAGLDPSHSLAASESFRVLARAWYAHNESSWSMDHALQVLASLERDVFPIIGAIEVSQLKSPLLLTVLRKVERRGAWETTRRIRRSLSAVFEYGIAEGICSTNPARGLEVALKKPPPARPQPALIEIGRCRELLDECGGVSCSASIKLASRFLALTAVRLGSVRGARWAEIEGLDSTQPLWRVPPIRMKLTVAKKREERFAHLVPLSLAAVEVLRLARSELHAGIVCKNALIFPGRRHDLSHPELSQPISEGAIGALYARTKFTGQHVPHGWRASFSTILHDDLGDDWHSVIEQTLAHRRSDGEFAYNRSQQLGLRRKIMARWAQLLT